MSLSTYACKYVMTETQLLKNELLLINKKLGEIKQKSYVRSYRKKKLLQTLI